MCGMNLAFDRTLIGPAMYFGLMATGRPSDADDMWAGWCVKVRGAGKEQCISTWGRGEGGSVSRCTSLESNSA